MQIHTLDGLGDALAIATVVTTVCGFFDCLGGCCGAHRATEQRCIVHVFAHAKRNLSGRKAFGM